MSDNPRDFHASNRPLPGDLPAREIDRRFHEALRVIKSQQRFTLEPDARKPAAEYPVRLGVRLG